MTNKIDSLKIVEGGYYRTREMEIVGPLISRGSVYFPFCFEREGKMLLVTEKGRVGSLEAHPLDLTEQVDKPESVNDASSVDLTPAFPRNYSHAGQNGMTLRQYYAGQAMAAILSSQATLDGSHQRGPSKIAIAAVNYADALIAIEKGSR